MHQKTLVELSADLQQGSCSSEELTRACLDRISQYNGELNCFVTVVEQQALAAASRHPQLVDEFQAGSSNLSLVPTFGAAGDRAPEWAALLALLLEFVETWDVDMAGRKPRAQRIYSRDGWRCMAPGCTSRRNLEVHHVVYRSQGGTNKDENLSCLCRFHHQMGEHGWLAQVRGEAPLGLLWSLGRGGRGGRFKNELRVP